MLHWLAITSFTLNFVALTLSLWVGLYLVTRSPQTNVSWLAAFTLWFMAMWFTYNALRVVHPIAGLPVWLGRFAMLSIVLWYQLTSRLRYEVVGRSPGRPQWRWQLWLVVLYGVSVVLAIDSALYLQAQADPGGSRQLTGYFSAQLPLAPSYVIFVGMVFALPLLSAFDLYRAQRQIQSVVVRRQLTHLILATAITQLGAIYSAVGTWLRPHIPTLPGYVLLAVGMIFLGYSVAKYRALVEGRTIERDALYSALGTGILTLLYLAIVLLLYNFGHASFVTVVLVPVCAIITHTLYDAGRALFDRLFYHGRLRHLRLHLRRLAVEAGTSRTLAEMLDEVMRSLHPVLPVDAWLVAAPDETGAMVTVTATKKLAQSVTAAMLAESKEIGEPGGTNSVAPPSVAPPSVALPSAGSLDPAQPGPALLVPLYAAEEQVGVLALGYKRSGAPYGAEDIDLLESLADQLATVIHMSRQQDEQAQTLDRLIGEWQEREQVLQHQLQEILAEQTRPGGPRPDDFSEAQLTKWVEDALRHLHDYAYLGEHPLAQFAVISGRLGADPEPDSQTQVTYIEQGKSLRELLLDAVNRLRPGGEEPDAHTVPAQEWHAFLVLHDAYGRGESTRDIMSRLYIGEGTYNRVRRRAIRSVAKVIQEMELNARHQAG